MKQSNPTEKDKQIVAYIKRSLYDILQCDYELRACIKNQHLDDDDWIEIIATMEQNSSQIASLMDKISFLTPEMRKAVDGKVNKLFAYVDKYSQYYDENINPDSNIEEPEVDEEEPEVSDVDYDNVGFEDDEEMSDSDIDSEAWDNAKRNNSFDLDGNIFDSVKPKRLNEEGTKLNSFGKHPGYRKKPMSLPQTGSDKEGDCKDWNDESVYSEQPFGEKIGSSAPYDEIINKAVNSIMESLKKKN
jgi:hypothetical protein